MRRGITLLELAIVLAIIGMLCAIGIPALLRYLDRSRVRHATNEVVTALAVARTTAISRATHVAALFDASRSSVVITIGADTILTRELGAIHGVTLRSNRDSTAYNPAGLGHGAANQTIVITRGAAADSVIVSRLGRVRR